MRVYVLHLYHMLLKFNTTTPVKLSALKYAGNTSFDLPAQNIYVCVYIVSYIRDMQYNTHKMWCSEICSQHLQQHVRLEYMRVYIYIVSYIRDMQYNTHELWCCEICSQNLLQYVHLEYMRIYCICVIWCWHPILQHPWNVALSQLPPIRLPRIYVYTCKHIYVCEYIACIL